MTARDVARALLGTWPAQVGGWEDETLEAYLAELDARGVTPNQALVAIRSYDPDADFPPSAAKLAQAARCDPSQPTEAELVQLLWERGGCMHARAPYRQGGWDSSEARARDDEQAILAAASRMHQLVGAFLSSAGVSRVRKLDPRDPEYGEPNRKRLYDEWARFLQASEGREIAQLVRSGRGGLGQLNPLAALSGARPALPSGDGR